MKTYLALTIFLLSFFPMYLFAQERQEDVIYTRNGSIYRGRIVEQVPNVSYKIEILGGNVILIPIADVTKITREDKFNSAQDYLPRRHRPVYEFHYKDKGYFFLGQALALSSQLGVQIVNGYKFNQFAYLGLGVGINEVMTDLTRNSDYWGTYIPIFIHYSGDILRKRITPFYSTELGYAVRVTSNYTPTTNDYTIVSVKGGMMAGAGFGVRFNTRLKVHFDLSAHADVKQSFSTINYNPYYSGLNANGTEHAFIVLLGLRFGVGF